MGQMTRRRHILCVISVLVIILGEVVDGATPDSSNNQRQKSDKPAESPPTKKTDTAAGGNGKVSGSQKALTFGECIPIQLTVITSQLKFLLKTLPVG
ncbi:hypothetical protein BaRGS_00037597 [Batillaria attramentaria]|uniref:Uncharacterized protein n=1 Tax=Batillaria attramentaria TaxID=370345 RepID=A0ABD0J849_9CAEN